MGTPEAYLDLLKRYKSHSLNPWKRVVESLLDWELIRGPRALLELSRLAQTVIAVYLSKGRTGPGFCPLNPSALGHSLARRTEKNTQMQVWGRGGGLLSNLRSKWEAVLSPGWEARAGLHSSQPYLCPHGFWASPPSSGSPDR